MGKERHKRKELSRLFSPLTRFWRHDGRRYCAIALCASLIAGNIGHMAVAASDDPDYRFELDRQELSDALQEAIANGNIVEKDFQFEGVDADTYLISLAADGCLYELTPEIEENDDDMSLRIFARLSETELINDVSEEVETDVDTTTESDGNENIYFLLTNNTNTAQTAVIRIGDKETQWITVEPYDSVEMPEPDGTDTSKGHVVGAEATTTPEVGPGVTDTETEGTVSTGGSVTVSGGSSGGGSGSGGGGGSSGSNSSAESTTESLENETEAGVPETEADITIEVTEPETDADSTEAETQTPETEVPETEGAENETDADIKIDIEASTPETDSTVESDVTVMGDEKSDDITVDIDHAGDGVTGTDENTGSSDAADKDSGIENTGNADTADQGNTSGDTADAAEDDNGVDAASENSSTDTVEADTAEADAAEADAANEDAGDSGNDTARDDSVTDTGSDVEVVAGISFHKTYRVASTATPSDATPLEATPSDATPSDASPSDAGEELDGEVYETVRLENSSAVVFVTTLSDIGITVDGHLIECEDECSGADCECGCHEVQKALIDDIEELLAEVRGYDENTDWEIMYAAYDKLYGTLPDAIDEAYDNGELTDAEYVYAYEVFEECGMEILARFEELGFDPYAVTTFETDAGIAAKDPESGSTYLLKIPKGYQATVFSSSSKSFTVADSGLSNAISAVASTSGSTKKVTITVTSDANVGDTETITVSWISDRKTRTATVIIQVVETTEAISFGEYEYEAKDFYWRFDAGDIYTFTDRGSTLNSGVTYAGTPELSGSSDLTALSEKIHVTFAQSGETGTDVPYSEAANGGGIPGEYIVVNSADLNSTIHITTDENYVITGYVIGCEFNNQYGEGCQTAESENLEVVISAEGLYQSDITLNASSYKGEDDQTGFFQHRSDDQTNQHYVLLLTVAQVNVDLKVEKEANRESVSLGEDDGTTNSVADDITYTVVASIENNDVINPTFDDAFLTRLVDGSLSIRYVDADGDDVYGEGSKILYELDSSKGVISVIGYKMPDGSEITTYTVGDDTEEYTGFYWSKENKFIIEYTYDTPDDCKDTVITNQVIAKGEKFGVESSVEDIGVAQVDVVVNSTDKGTLRVNKTFSGLTYDDIHGMVNEATGERSGGVLEKFKIVVTSSTGTEVATFKTSDGSLKYYSGSVDDPTFVYYGTVYNLEPGTYTVTEYNYDVTEYNYISYTYTVQVGETDVSESDITSGEEDSAKEVKVVKGTTTFVRFTNTYSNSTFITIEKQVTGNMADVNKAFSFEASLSNGLLPTTADTTKGGSDYEVEDNKATFSLKDGESITITGIPIGATVTIKEVGCDGYEVTAVQVESSTGADSELTVNVDTDKKVASIKTQAVSGGSTIVVINDNTDTIDTGILLDSMPYVLILGAVVAGIAFYFIRKKKDDEDDLD